MSAVNTTVTHMGAFMWRLVFNDVEDWYYVWVDGLLRAVTEHAFYDITLEPGVTSEVLVYDSASDAPDGGYPARSLFQWRPDANAVQYRVDRYVDAAWTEVYRVVGSSKSVYWYHTPTLIDGVLYRHRVVPIGPDGVDGDPKDFEGIMVCYPAWETSTYEYDDVSGKMKVTA